MATAQVAHHIALGRRRSAIAAHTAAAVAAQEGQDGGGPVLEADPAARGPDQVPT